ncbi:hypothetical protein N7471_002342 [Penicillium samsonianum]|uniref:uncharacterized protein n=1 Tax=Penicillium samsonianum TaxID=1882272 RepID=UPI0025475625|nr:uncharacterized protein N7471_002342 [Penicillium samsonianum]KAJ6142889.1 hypothetical protein N7471_002342 [Penicillium samsonianum]
MQVESPMAEAQGHRPEAEGVFNHFYQNLTFQSILSRYNPPEISEAEIRRMREVLTLAGNNYDERFPATVRATDFWYWCGLRPERWGIVPDQALWNEFTREFELRRGSPNARTQAILGQATWNRPTF